MMEETRKKLRNRPGFAEERAKKVGSRVSVSSAVVGLTEDVIDADVIEVGESHQNFICQGLSSGFQVTVFPLGEANLVCQLLLRQVRILAQIADSVFHEGLTPFDEFLTKNYSMVTFWGLTFR